MSNFNRKLGLIRRARIVQIPNLIDLIEFGVIGARRTQSLSITLQAAEYGVTLGMVLQSASTKVAMIILCNYHSYSVIID